jgi:hypothetical protein
VALWKDPAHGVQEISLDPGAMGILLSASTDRSVRRCFDGRRPVDNGTELVNMSVYQVRPAGTGSPSSDSPPRPNAPAELTDDDLTILTSWAEAVADAVAFAPERLDALRRRALGEGEWRRMLGLAEPTGYLASAMHDMFAAARIGAAGGPPDLAIPALLEREPGRPGFQAPTRRILRSVLEQRRARQRSG